MPRKMKRFTQFDAMEERGDFEANTANATSPGYVGPVEFPRLVYFAEEEIIASGSWEDIKGKGTILVGELKALRHQTVSSREELADALASGWFKHPAEALKALIEANKEAGIPDSRKVPPISAQETIRSYEDRIAELEAKLAEANEHQLVSSAVASKPAHSGRAAPRISTLDG